MMSLALTWFLFFLCFLALVISSLFLPRFFISLVRQWRINVVFLGVFVLSFITSLPELLSILLLPATIKNTSGIFKSFSVVLGSNLITGTGFCLLSLIYFKSFSQLTVSRLVRWSCLAVFFLNGFFLLVLFYPDSFLNWRVAHWSLVGLFFVIIYFVTLFYSSLPNKRTPTDDQLSWDFDKIPFKTNVFALIVWIIFLVAVLVASIFALIALTSSLQATYQWSDWTIGGVFFAFATTSPEIWTAFSLYYLGFGLAAWGVVIGSHLFNWVLLFLVDFTTDLDIFRTLATEKIMMELTLAVLFLSLLFYLLSWRVFRHHKTIYFFFPLTFCTIMVTTLFTIG